MLVLARKLFESVRVGKEGELVIKVLSIQGNQVRIGIGAPKSVPVHREEVFLRIKEKEQTGT